MNIVNHLANKLTSLNGLLQSQNIFFLTTVPLLICSSFLLNSLKLIVTVYEKLACSRLSDSGGERKMCPIPSMYAQLVFLRSLQHFWLALAI